MAFEQIIYAVADGIASTYRWFLGELARGPEGHLRGVAVPESVTTPT